MNLTFENGVFVFRLDRGRSEFERIDVGGKAVFLSQVPTSSGFLQRIVVEGHRLNTIWSSNDAGAALRLTGALGDRVSVSDDAEAAIGVLSSMSAIAQRSDVELEEIRNAYNYKLFPFQRVGVKFGIEAIKTRGYVLIADEMGLGKTAQALNIVLRMPELKRVLIVCQSSQVYSWESEIKKWFSVNDTRFASPAMFNSTGYELKHGAINFYEYPSRKIKGAPITIVTYGMLQKKVVANEIIDAEFDIAILDECHSIKNRESAQSKNAVYMCSRIPRKILMTGTPLDRPEHIFTLLQAMGGQTLAGTWAHFKKKYSGAAGSAEISDRLRRDSVMIRRLKKDVGLELPEITSKVTIIDAAGGKDWSSVVDRVSSTMDAAGNPYAFVDSVITEYIPFEEIARERSDAAKRKVPHIASRVKEILDGGVDKIVVFYHHKELGAAMLKEFPDAVVIDGSVSAKERGKAVEKFQSSDSRVFLGSVTAAGTGITLTAANYVLFAEMDWRETTMRQARDRIHRIGQGRSCTVEILLVNRSIDMMVYTIASKKSEIIDLFK